MTRFLITGGAGFIGSHLCQKLLDQGHTVAVLDNLSTGRQDNIAHLSDNPRFQLFVDNIEQMDVLDELAAESEVIIHLAAVVGVDLVVQDPVRTITTNIGGTEAVLQTARKHGCKTLLASTSEVYGKGVRVPFAEDDDVILGPTSRHRWAYAATKMVDEFLLFGYGHQYALPGIAFRLFNTVGPRQTGRYGMVMPRFVRAALEGEPLRVFGDGTQRRCFCHVHDVVHAIIALNETESALSQVFNIGSKQETSILDLAKRVISLTHSRSEIVLVPYEQAYPTGYEDMRRRVPDITRIHTATGWSPKHNLDEIILDIVQSMQ